MTKTLLLLLSCLPVLSLSAYASSPSQIINDAEWTLKKSADGVKVYASTIANSKHKAVLATTTVEASPQQVINLIRDTQTCTQWVYRCKSSKIYKAVNAQEEYIYTSIRMPFPFSNRDILAHIKWTTNPDTHVTVSTGIATKGILKKQRHHSRIENATMIWEITPQDNGQTTIRSYGHIDPAGEMPTWLSNRFSSKAPLNTMIKLRKLLASTDKKAPI